MKPDVPTYRKLAVACCFAACVGDFAVTFLAGFFLKDYHSLTQTESLLGVQGSPVAPYMNAWGVVLGLLFLALAYALYKAGYSKGPWQLAVVWLLALYGLGEGAGSGLFPYNHMGGELTLSGKLHSVFSGMGVASLMALPFVWMKLLAKQAYWLIRFTRFVAVSGLLLVVVFQLARQDLLPLKGLWQRLFLLDYYVWLMVLTKHLSLAQGGRSVN